MEDLIGLLIFLYIFGSRIGNLFGKRQEEEKSIPPDKPQRHLPPKRQTLSEWFEELERRMYPIEKPAPQTVNEPQTPLAPIAPSEPVVQVRPSPETTFPVNPPQPERTSLTSTTLREPSQTAEQVFGPTDLRRAIVMSEILGPPRCKQRRRPLR